MLMIWVPVSLLSQNKPFIHFTEDDGLANNGVRSITKDRDGILWLGTENGISRYDGQKFLNIRKSDGLPGNRVWAIASDHKSKIFAGCYHDGLAVIENNKVIKTYHIKARFPDSIRRLYYSDNFQMLFVGTDFGIYAFKDSIFYEMKYEKDSTTKYSVLNITEYKNHIYFTAPSGNVSNPNGFYRLNVNQENISLTKVEGSKNDTKFGFALAALNDTIYATNGIEIFTCPIANLPSWQLFSTTKDNFMPWVCCPIGNHELLMGGFNNGNAIGGLRILNTQTGVLERTSWQIQDGPINDLLNDTETGIIWVCADEGLIALTKTLFEVTKLKDIPGIMDIEQSGGVVYILAADGLYTCSNGKIDHTLTKLDIANGVVDRAIEYFNKNNAYLHPSFKVKWSAVAKRLHTTNNKLFIVTSNGSISIPDLKTYYPFTSEKFVLNDQGGAYFVQDYCPLYYYKNVENGKYRILEGDHGYIKDILKTIRVNDLFLFASYYNGLYAIKNEKVYYLNENNSELNNYLTDIDIDSDGEIWCTSIEGNLFNIGFDGKLFVKLKLNKQNSGIIGDAYKWLKFNDKSLYVGTDKGLNIIPKGQLYKDKIDSVRFFNAANGYDFISADNPFSDSKGNIYVRTIDQLIKITKTSIPKSSAKILLENIRLNERTVRLEELAGQTLPYSTNTVNLEFLLSKYPSSRNTSYRYRINEGTWNEGGKLNLESIKPGKYSIELKARDAESGQKYSQDIQFEISSPVWQSGWFIAFLILLVAGISFLIFKLRIAAVKKQQFEKYRLLRENSELQIRSLQVQMNPHFVFNSLNSIQNFIVMSNTRDALIYLGSLGSLIRMNLENVSKEYILLENEIRFLTKYIQIEKLRFKEKLNIQFANDIANPDILLPPMLVQPIIENAIKHGISDLKSGAIIKVDFSLENEILVIAIEDNGVGRRVSEKDPANNHQSKGLELIEERIKLLNEMKNTNKNSISIFDLNENGRPTGTRVLIKLELILDSKA